MKVTGVPQCPAFDPLVTPGIHEEPYGHLFRTIQRQCLTNCSFEGPANVLEEVLPEFSHLAETLRVTDVPLETGGLILRVLMNADLDKAVGFLASPQQKIGSVEPPEAESIDRGTNDHWRWRFRMAQRIAADLDPQKFGVNAFYLIGSTKNATAGPASRHRHPFAFSRERRTEERTDSLARRLESLPRGNQLPPDWLSHRWSTGRAPHFGYGHQRTFELRRQDRCSHRSRA